MFAIFRVEEVNWYQKSCSSHSETGGRREKKRRLCLPAVARRRRAESLVDLKRLLANGTKEKGGRELGGK